LPDGYDRIDKRESFSTRIEADEHGFEHDHMDGCRGLIGFDPR